MAYSPHYTILINLFQVSSVVEGIGKINRDHIQLDQSLLQSSVDVNDKEE